MARKLPPRLVAKPWGRDRLPAMFGGAHQQRIGEVWFSDGGELPLLVKYIFTSERLSIQVHPDDAQAAERGLGRGKSECWLIVEAEPGAELGLGLTRPAGEDELRAAALDGSIEHLIDWRPVRAGDFFMVPANTVHAIGAGITLLEFQQNSDTTFRLYDYGRPRELHLDDGLAVARREPYPAALSMRVAAGEERVLADRPQFSLVQALGPDGIAAALAGRRRWVIPLEGEVRSGGLEAAAGECILVEPGEAIGWSDGRVVIGAEGRL